MVTIGMGLCIAALAALQFPPEASAAPACGKRVNNTQEKLLACVKLEGVRSHQAALQAIADANGGIRTSGTLGYDETPQPLPPVCTVP